MSNSSSGMPRARAIDIDWREIYRRVDLGRKAVEQVGVLAPDETKRILRERAIALARVPGRAGSLTETLDVIEFILAYEAYAVESRYVAEVYPLKALTPVPCTPAFVAGIVNLRGRILSVIDIRRFFDLPQKGLPDLNKIIVLRSNAMEFGIFADVILGTRKVSIDDLQVSLPTLTGIRQDYLRGITGNRTVVLDGGKLLSDPKFIVHEEVPV